MMIWPQTLFGRLFLATVAVIATMLLVVVALVLHERRELAFSESGTGVVATKIADTIRALDLMSADARSTAIDELRSHRIRIERPEPRPPQRRADDIAAARRAFVRQLRKELGADYRVEAEPAAVSANEVIQFDMFRGDWEWPSPTSSNAQGKGFRARPVDVKVRLPDGTPIVFRAPTPRGAPPLPNFLFIQLSILTLVLGIVLYAMTRALTNPLAELAAAANAAGRGIEPQKLPERGVLEVRSATRAFNAMQERLSRYLDSRTRVLAAMSHDLRTPLTRLNLRMESIEDDELRRRCQSDLNEMTLMVNSALGMFRSLNQDEPATSIDVNALLRELQGQTVESGYPIEIVGQASATYIGQALALKRCLNNLIGNAVRYGGDCCISVQDSTSALTLEVIDHGPGIPEEALEQVFEPFFRLESSRSRETGGAGLGLSIARDIAQAHGGTLRLRNGPAGGLIATLILPRRHIS